MGDVGDIRGEAKSLKALTEVFIRGVEIGSSLLSENKQKDRRLHRYLYCKGRNFRRRKFLYFSVKNLSYGV